jgi:hypothetical protein
MSRFHCFRIRPSLVSLLAASALAFTAVSAGAADATPAAQTPQPAIVLPAKASEMLRAPLAVWQPLLTQAGTALDERMRLAGQAQGAGNAALIEGSIHRTLLAQAREDWPQVIEAARQARALQASEAGRQTAGLLNEIIARQVMAGGDGPWLRYHLRDRVLAMPWADVEGAIRALRSQLAVVQTADIERFVTTKLDLGAEVSERKVSAGYLFQLLGLRFQLAEVMPRRAALLAGLDDAIAQRDGEAAR